MSIETPFLPRSIFGEDFEKVYEPAEDTYLLLDALEQDLNELRQHVDIVLECGSGSGVVSTAISKSLGTDKLIIATDINPDACKVSQKCAKYHNQYINVVRTDLAECLSHRLRHKVDLLIFNPPYVPTDKDETQAKGDQQLNLSWAGGQDGRESTDSFLDYVPKLLSKPHGYAYMIAIRQNKVGDLTDILSPSLKGEVVMSRRAGQENLSVIRYRWFMDSFK